MCRYVCIMRPCAWVGWAKFCLPRLECHHAGCCWSTPACRSATVSVFRTRTGGYLPLREDLPAAWHTPREMAVSLSGARELDLQAAAVSLVPSIRDILSAIAGTTALSAGAHERIGRDMLRIVLHCRRGRRLRARRNLPGRGLVELGRFAVAVIRTCGLLALRGTRPDLSPDGTGRGPGGASPSGKATDFDSVIRRFESSRPSQAVRRGGSVARIRSDARRNHAAGGPANVT